MNGEPEEVGRGGRVAVMIVQETHMPAHGVTKIIIVAVFGKIAVAELVKVAFRTVGVTLGIGLGVAIGFPIGVAVGVLGRRLRVLGVVI